jgi:hypothetical protein
LNLVSTVVLLLALVVLPASMSAQQPSAPQPGEVVEAPCPVPQQPKTEGPAAAPGPASPSQTGWQYGPPSPFEYQRFDAIFVPGPDTEPWADKVYFMGGRISAPAELPDIWVFDPVTGVYTDTGANMIEDVSNYNANLIMDDSTGRGPAVYVVGGYDKDLGSGGGNLGLVQRYYPQSNTIEALPSADNWPGQVAGYTVGGMGTAVVGDVIYVFGGWESNVSPYFYDGTWVLDPRQPSGSRWTDLGVTLNPGRSYILSAAQDGKIYAIGGVWGYVGGDLVPTDAVEVLDTANVAAGWTAVAPLPWALAEGRGFGFDDDTQGADAPWDGLLFTAGGGDWPDISREAMQYDVASDTWDQSFPDLNDRRVNNAGAFVPLCTPDPDDGLPGLWVFGGRSENGCDPPYGATEFYDLPCADCIGLTGAIASGPDVLLPEETGTYTATLEPPNATEPIDIAWSNGMTGTSSVYSWPEPGFYTVVVTGSNCAGLSVVTASFEVEVDCVELTGATVSGPEEVLLGETATYTVTLAPPEATGPIDILWSNGAISYTATYSWTTPGTQTVVVTATNCGGSAVVTGTIEVEVTQPLHRIYLPIVVRN